MKHFLRNLADLVRMVWYEVGGLLLSAVYLVADVLVGILFVFRRPA
jgi:hypothetical protein